ncbi:helix-turn-helix domain-containing protein [Spirosoma sp. KUDC1026]|uniref:helix-turn-helix domain-containing protein n=1 Tax=Spirosoma sp. KUDC1026 TaxID=2745947 RepID=UPI00159BDE74|nr:AraC family transcriptional regulator [Spirosoma sp. KUDC1026]QKZ13844.1 helix-turn-helix transcriptional regulator [Spirosoma sp. KUDC1026]
MKDIIPQRSLHIEQLDLNQWATPIRFSDCYELILIQSGKGHHLVNDKRFTYQPGDVFFLGAHDQYSFLTMQPTSLYRLSFSPLYISSLLIADDQPWAYVNRSTSPCLGSIATDSTDQDNLRALVTMILSEERSLRHLTGNPIVESLMKIILSLVDRLLGERGAVIPSRQTFSLNLTRQIIAYIGQHIGEPERLRMDTIADAFNYSPGHLSTLFKQQVGDSIQQFIIRHKLKLVATKLRQTPLTVSQIADEFGFSDVCHLNKLFKRYYNHTPTAYRQVLSA